MNTTFAHMPHVSETRAIQAARGVRPNSAGVHQAGVRVGAPHGHGGGGGHGHGGWGRGGAWWGPVYAGPAAWCQDKNGNWAPCPTPTLISPYASSVGWQTQARGGYMHTTAVGALSTTADDVHNAKLTLDTQMMATNRQWELAGLGNASNSPTFSQAAANDYPSWDAFYQTWNSFAIEDSSFLGASDDMARLTDYSNQLAAWQARLVTDTQNSPGGPMTPILKATPPAVPATGDALGVDSTLTRVGVIAGLILLGIVAVEVLPAILPHHARYRHT